MKLLPDSAGVLMFFCSVLLLSHANAQLDKTVEVVGTGVCADCSSTNVESGRVFSGLHVAVHCKLENGIVETRGVGALDRTGRFKVVLPATVMRDGELADACFAQLHSASSSPCPSLAGSELSNLIVKTNNERGHTLSLAGGDLAFSRTTCASAFFWPFFKFHFWHHHFVAPTEECPPPPMYSYRSPPPPPAYVNKPPAPMKIYRSPPPPPHRRKPPPPPPHRRKPPPPPPRMRKPSPPPPRMRNPSPPPPMRKSPPPPPFHKPHNPSPQAPIRKKPPPPPKSPVKKRPPPPPTYPVYKHPPPPPYHPYTYHPPPAYSNPPPSPSFQCMHWYKHPFFSIWKPCHPHPMMKPWFWSTPTFGNRMPFFPPMSSHP